METEVRGRIFFFFQNTCFISQTLGSWAGRWGLNINYEHKFEGKKMLFYQDFKNHACLLFILMSTPTQNVLR